MPEPVPVGSSCVVVPELAAAAGGATPTGSVPTGSVPDGAEVPARAAPPSTSGSGAGARGLGSEGAPIVVGVSGTVDPAHAPMPRTPAEELVFSHLYEPLVRIDCEGRVGPGVAESWSEQEGGRVWTFRIRPDLRDWRGEAVTAHTVASSLSRAAAPGGPAPGESGPSSGIESLTVLDGRTLRASLRSPVPVDHFARPHVAVTTGVGADGWPLGTGGHQPDAGASAGGTYGPTRLVGPGTLEVRPVSGDARDALEAGIDVLVTRDAAVIDYAEASPALSTAPLAWDRAYLLVTPAAALPMDSTRGVSEPGPKLVPVPSASRSALARDAVRVEARPAGPHPTGPCDAAGAAEGPPGPAPSTGGARLPPRTRRIVYPSSDTAARSLAERLVALALSPERPEGVWLAQGIPELAGSGRVGAAGLDDAAFEVALRAGRDVAYVLPVRLSALADACDLARAAAARAPWLLSDRNVAAERGPAVLPLVEARSTLVYRTDVAGVRVDGEGLPRLEGLRRVSPGAGP